MKTFRTVIIPVVTRQKKVVYTTSDRKHKEWRIVEVPVTQLCHVYTFSYNGQVVTFYVPVSHMNKTNPYCFIFDENGKTINAVWQHGRSGSADHIEPALFNWRNEALVSSMRYCNGYVKDSYKYMRRVLF